MTNEIIRRLVARLHARLQVFARRVVGASCTPDEAHGLVQEAFMRLWQDRVMSEEHARRWLYVTTKRLAIDLRRRRGLASELSFVEASASHEGRVEARAELERFRVLLATLNPRAQEAVRLKLVDELDNTEIAEVLEVTPNHVGVILHESLTKVRTAMRRGESP